MKKPLTRRQFIQLSGVSFGGALGASVLSGCQAQYSSGSTSNQINRIPLPQDEAGRWWLSGNHAPVEIEQSTQELNVEGEIPSELAGIYVRNGSNPTSETDHPFLGDGMVHGLRLAGGQAEWYGNRFVGTKLYGTTGLEFDPFDYELNYSNVSVINHAGKLLSLGETGYPYLLSDDDLSTLGSYNFDDKLNTWMTAHPKIDPETGELHFFGYAALPPYLTYHKADSQGELVRSVPITIPASVMMHDFAMTKKHVLFYDLPIVFSLNDAVAGSSFPFLWDDEHTARIGIMPHGGSDADVKWFEVEPCFIFHTVNAFVEAENENLVTLRASRLDAPFWKESTTDFSQPSFLHSWTFNLETDEVTEGRLSDIPFDFGQVNPQYTGRPNRYCYGLDFSSRPVSPEPPKSVGLARYDHQNRVMDRLSYGSGIQADEAILVPRQNAEDENDGWLMHYAFDPRKNLSALYIIDAQNFSAGPVAKINLPYRIPFGFHGTWMAD